jgi:hypothetical protein
LTSPTSDPQPTVAPSRESEAAQHLRRDSHSTLEPLDLELVENVSDVSGSLHSFGDDSDDVNEEAHPQKITRADSISTVTFTLRYLDGISSSFCSQLKIFIRSQTQSSLSITIAKLRMPKMF